MRETVDTPQSSATAPNLTFSTVVELLSILDGSEMPTRIEFRDGPLKLKIQRGFPIGTVGESAVAAATPVAATAATASSQPVEAPQPLTETSPNAEAASSAPGESVNAPIAGVFYTAPSPGAEPFVEVGQRVSADDAIGIVEVMKLMNTVRAGVSGIVTEVSVEDAQLVEFGQSLIRIDPEG